MDENRIRQGFSKKKLPTYTGMRKGRMARDWAREIERILHRLSIPISHLRVELAVQTFTRDAVIWWKVAQGYYGTRRFTWEEFIEMFYRHHCRREYQVVLEHMDLEKRRRKQRLRK